MRLFGFVQPFFKRLCETVTRGLCGCSAHCFDIFPDKLSPVMYVFHVLASIIQRHSANIQSPAFARLWDVGKSKVSNCGLIQRTQPTRRLPFFQRCNDQRPDTCGGLTQSRPHHTHRTHRETETLCRVLQGG